MTFANTLTHNGNVFHLARPSVALGSAFLAFLNEFKENGEGHFVFEEVLESEGLSAYLAWLEQGERGELGKDGYSPWSAYWLVDARDGSIAGVSSLRHELNAFMQERGGHVGYRVRPSRRRAGLGGLLLQEMTRLAHQRGIDPLMVVCHDDNPASAAVILKCGGVEYEALQDGERMLRRFRLATAG
jgi:predicted acetyltransferase